MKVGLNLGEWYPVEEPEYICANENPYHGCMRLGLESNLLFFLDGPEQNIWRLVRCLYISSTRDAILAWFPKA